MQQSHHRTSNNRHKNINHDHKNNNNNTHTYPKSPSSTTSNSSSSLDYSFTSTTSNNSNYSNSSSTSTITITTPTSTSTSNSSLNSNPNCRQSQSPLSISSDTPSTNRSSVLSPSTSTSPIPGPTFSPLSRTRTRTRTKTRTMNKRVVFIDWDDTFFPTTIMKSEVYRGFNNQQMSVFLTNMKVIRNYICLILERLVQYFGAENIYIITNGSKDWILCSLQMNALHSCMMGVYDLLVHKYPQIHRISCQHLYKREFPAQYTLWKEKVFAQILEFNFGNANLNNNNNDNLSNQNNNNSNSNCRIIPQIISIGDSFCEYNASYTTTKNIPHRVLQRIKLSEAPGFETLAAQFNFLYKFIPLLVQRKYENKNIDHTTTF